MSQKAEILQWLKSGKPITVKQAINDLRVYRLAARIADLRGSGYRISTQIVKRPSKRTGRSVRYASYTLEDI